MRQSRARAEDSRLDVERRLKYLGAAWVSLDVLRLYWDGRGLRREPDANHVENLKEVFSKEGCHPLQVQNHVPAKIDQQSLETALKKSEVSAGQLLTQQPGGFPKLVFPHGFKLDYLHGLHRIEAAREFLSPTDKWWIVDLYLSDLDAELETYLIEEYSNEEKPSDGEIYRKIRQYEHHLSFKGRWEARLAGNRAKYLQTLLHDEELTEAFDDLLAIYGLWDNGMRLTTLHKIVAMRCREPILNYLGHIKKFYSDLVRGDKNAMRRIDSATVTAVELKAPRASTEDAKDLGEQVLGGKIFSAFTAQERDDIWSRLKIFEGLVPSLSTFFRDLLYLERLVNSVRRLTTLPKGKTIIEALQRRFTGVNQEEGQLKVQVAEGAFRRRRGTHGDQIDYGVRQLFAFAMRFYHSMPKKPERQNLVKKPRAHADPAVLRRFADLASELGFESPEITALKKHPITGATRDPPQSRPDLVTSGSGVGPRDRSGIPRDRAFDETCDFLFLDHLHAERQHRGKGITHFFVRRSVYLAFFGQPSGVATTASSSIADSPQASCQSVGGTPETIPDDLHGSQRWSMTRPQVMEEDVEEMEDEDSVLSYYNAENSSRRREASGSQERLEREMQDHLEQERLRQERLEQANLEERKVYQERLRQARLEWERLKQEKQRQQELEQELQRRLERERLELDKSKRERLERERMEQDQFEREKVEIHFKIWDQPIWRAVLSLAVHPSNSFEVERLAKKYLRKGFRVLNTRLQMTAPRDCFEEVLNDGTHTILLVAQDGLDTSKEMMESASALHADALRVLALKRKRHEDHGETRGIEFPRHNRNTLAIQTVDGSS